MTEDPALSLEEQELNKKISEILHSPARKKLVIAGPGTGKTSLFKKILENLNGSPNKAVVLTFINALRDDLERDLGELANVYTLHSFCLKLLYKYPALRLGLTSDFLVVPRLASLIADDWRIIKGCDSPKFVSELRKLTQNEETQFYLERGNYYNSVDFDDIVYRTYLGYTRTHITPNYYDIVLIDEFQDFNPLEAGIVNILGENNNILIAGDDDQALYSQLRGSSWDHIRSMSKKGEYEVYTLPFCLRCPKVIVDAVNDILSFAGNTSKLQGRINKPFRDFPKVKGLDSTKYPKIIDVETSVQRKNANYMAMYIEQEVRKISKEEVEEANQKNYPVVLVIVANPYREMISDYLLKAGIDVKAKKKEDESLVDRNCGLSILQQDPSTNIGWRILLHADNPPFLRDVIISSAPCVPNLVDLIPVPYREVIIAQAISYIASEDNVEDDKTDQLSPKSDLPQVRVSSFEGSKGMSAQHVFIVGLHNDELPKNPDSIKDIEICKIIVGLTRTRKKCTLLHTRRFDKSWKKPSVFLSWINNTSIEHIKVDKDYWKNQG
jgi:superfamily I DNA/RNA helicase